MSRVSYEPWVFPEPSPQIAERIASVSGARRALLVEGVPREFIGRRYRADEQLGLLEATGGAPVLRFASTGLSGAIGLALPSGHVIEVIDVKRPHPRVFVNSTLEQFTRTVRAVLARLPFYGADASDEQWKAVARELHALLREIDAEAAVPDRYWSTFVDDVEMGDLSTEQIVAASTRAATR